MEEPIPEPATPMSISRIASISDGVFAIALTLLVFNIKVPDLEPDLVARQLPQSLRALWPYLLSYVLSFVMIGVYWVAHHNIFHGIRRSNRVLLWINLLFLMGVSFLPFPAALLGRYPRQQTSLVIYGATLIYIGLVLQLLFWYATEGGRLTSAATALPAPLRRQATRKILTIPAVSIVSIVISSISPRASLALYVLVPFLYVLPNRLDRQWSRARGSDDQRATDVEKRNERERMVG